MPKRNLPMEVPWGRYSGTYDVALTVPMYSVKPTVSPCKYSESVMQALFDKIGGVWIGPSIQLYFDGVRYRSTLRNV